MVDKKFILEHINELSELRDFNEVYEYFKAKGMNINAEEIMALKGSSDMIVVAETPSQTLTMEQLNYVAGGSVTGLLLTIGLAVGGVVLSAVTSGAAAAVVAGVIGAVSVGFDIYGEVSGKQASDKSKTIQINTNIDSYNIGNSVG